MSATQHVFLCGKKNDIQSSRFLFTTEVCTQEYRYLTTTWDWTGTLIRTRLIAMRSSLDAEHPFCPISARDEAMKKKKKKRCVTSTEGNLSANGYAVIQRAILYRHLFDIIVSLRIMKIQWRVANRQCQFIRFAMKNCAIRNFHSCY